MPTTEVHIDSIQLELRGVSPAAAQAALASLGPALHDAVATRLAGRNATMPTHADIVTAPSLRVPTGADATSLRNTLAQHLATTIAGQLPPASSR